MKPRILLASAMDWPFPARLAGAFASLGARVEAVCLSASPLRHARAVSRLYPFSAPRPLNALTRALQSRPDLVIPCDDLMAELLWRLDSSHAYPLLAARNSFLRIAEDIGAPVATTIATPDTDAFAAATAQLGLPLVVKCDASWGGDGVAIARTQDEAKAAFARFSRPSRAQALARALRRREAHFLVRARFSAAPGIGVQRFIPGHPATSAIACWQGKLLAANHFDVVVAQGTGPATVVAPSRCPQMEDAARRIAARFELSGLFGLDYMRAESGEVFLLEINPRATPTTHLALGPGQDLVAALLTAPGFPVPDRPSATQKPQIALFPQEMRRDAKSPYLADAWHDLPDDPGLARQLGWQALTSFSADEPRLSPQPSALGPLAR